MHFPLFRRRVRRSRTSRRSPQISGPVWGCPVGPVVRNPNLSRLLILTVAYTLVHRALRYPTRRYATSCIWTPPGSRLRRVGLAHAILVSLSEQSGSGYELAP